MLRHIFRRMSTTGPLTAMDEISQSGAFERTASTYRHVDGTLPLNSGRYLLYVALACPWANRTLIARELMGLQDTVQVVSVDAVMQRTKPEDEDDKHTGWMFADKPKGEFVKPDPLFNAKTLREVYEKLSGDKVSL